MHPAATGGLGVVIVAYRHMDTNRKKRHVKKKKKKKEKKKT